MKPDARAFTLLEITLALGLLATCGLAMLALLASTLNQTRAIREATVAVLLGRNVRTLLRDPAWPEGRHSSGDGSWKAATYFDGSGALLPDATGAAVRAELTGGQSPAFASPWLEQVAVRLVSTPAGPELGRLTLQRHFSGEQIP